MLGRVEAVQRAGPRPAKSRPDTRRRGNGMVRGRPAREERPRRGAEASPRYTLQCGETPIRQSTTVSQYRSYEGGSPLSMRNLII
eukprot:scaffold12763_cov115-Isochrysis_galbana.AAC.2